MKVRALAELSTPKGPKEIGEEFDLAADKAAELRELGWVEEVKETKSTKGDKETAAADAKA